LYGNCTVQQWIDFRTPPRVFLNLPLALSLVIRIPEAILVSDQIAGEKSLEIIDAHRFLKTSVRRHTKPHYIYIRCAGSPRAHRPSESVLSHLLRQGGVVVEAPSIEPCTC
jgi:hypothetical protein